MGSAPKSRLVFEAPGDRIAVMPPGGPFNVFAQDRLTSRFLCGFFCVSVSQDVTTTPGDYLRLLLGSFPLFWFIHFKSEVLVGRRIMVGDKKSSDRSERLGIPN